MSKTIYAVPVSELPFIDSLRELSMSERRRLGLYLPGGETNYYRIVMMKGFGGSATEETWIRQGYSGNHKGHHNCCGSKVAWRHKVSCPRLDFKA